MSIPRNMLLMLLVMALLGAGPPFEGLDPDKRLTQYLLDHWGADHGLPQQSIKAIVRTEDGYLWMGTQEGLVRFDGLRFVTFDKGSGSLPHNHVTALAADGTGGLWVGTLGGGLVRARQGRFTSYTVQDGLPSNHVSTLAVDDAGTLWVGTNDAGLVRFQDGQFTHFTEEAGLPGRQVNTLFEDQQGTLWVGLQGGLAYAEVGAGTAARFTPVEKADALDVTALAEGKDSTLWVGTRDSGLYTVRQHRLAKPSDAASPGRSILALLVDRSGTLWAGLNHGGLARLGDDAWSALTARQGLRHDVVRVLYDDPEGSLWVGTDGGGLHRLRDGKFTTFTTKEGLAHDFVYTAYEDRQGAMWVGTEGGGASRIQEGEVTNFTTQDGLAGDIVLSFAETDDGSLWIGTYRSGLSRLRNGRFTNYTTEDGLPGNTIFGLFTDSRGHLWIATGQGLARFHDEQFATYTTQQGLASNQVTALAEDTAGRLWVGTYDGGLNSLRDGQITATYTTDSGLLSNTILSLYADPDGSVWVGTNEGGLHNIRRERILTFTLEDGLPSDKVFQILEDAAGRLWMTSNKGLFSVEKESLYRQADGRIEKLSPTLYDRHDGLKSQEFNGGVQPAGWRSRDGRLWLPTSEGVVVIDPQDIRVNRFPPPVVIESVWADGQEVAPAPDLRIGPGPRKIEFQYVGLSFVASEKVRYLYILEGYDETWNEGGSSRRATYTNLPPGQYTFRVIARNSDGVWSETQAAFSFYLQPFFYQTYWFYLCLFLVGVVLLLTLYHLRVRHLRRRQQELEAQVETRTHDLRIEKERTEEALREAEYQRELAEQARTVIEEQADQLREMDRVKTRFFNNISHEFRTPLTLTIGPLENALTGIYGPLSKDLRMQLSIMLRNARRLLRLINQLLDLSKLESDRFVLQRQYANIVPFVEGVALSFSAFAERKNIDLVYTSDADVRALPFDTGCMEKVVFNLLSNAIKFTPEGGCIEVRVEADVLEDGKETQEAVAVIVSDTGPGIPAEEVPYIFDRFHQVNGAMSHVQEGTGIGLALVKELVELHGGTIAVQTAPGEGTTFRIRLPLQPADALPGEMQGDGYVEPEEPVSRGPLVEVAVFDDEDEAVHISAGEEAPAAAGVSDAEAHILIVDDNVDIRNYMAGCLKQHFRVQTAGDGQAALEAIAACPPDLVISDIMMPVVDGYALCRTIKQDESLHHIPVLLLTAKASMDDKIEGLEAGADDYLTKPFNARELMVRVRNLLDLRTHQRALQTLNNELNDTNEALLEANEQKSQLLRIVAHDLKNPLSGIRGFAAVLKQEIEDDGQVHELLDLIINASDRMSNLIADILEADALESGALGTDRAPVDIEALARQVVRRNEPQAAQKQQRIAFSAEAPGCIVEASEEWIQEAMDNILSNAIKYSPYDTGINVRVGWHEGRARFEVQDEGPGISEDEMPRLFKKFQRLSAEPTGGESSTGLGLSIVKQIVEAHDGSVWAESTVGRGSTFIIELPMYAGRDADEVPQPAPDAAASTQPVPHSLPTTSSVDR